MLSAKRPQDAKISSISVPPNADKNLTKHAGPYAWDYPEQLLTLLCALLIKVALPVSPNWIKLALTLCKLLITSCNEMIQNPIF